MIYAICDPRQNRQEIYIGETSDLKQRLKGHKNHYEKNPIARSRLADDRFSLQTYWKADLREDGIAINLIVIDPEEIYDEFAWMAAFAQHDFILTNSRIDIDKACSGHNYKSKFTPVPGAVFIEALDKLRSFGYYTRLLPLVSITTKTYRFRSGDTLDFLYKTYPDTPLKPYEINSFTNEYWQLLDTCESSGIKPYLLYKHNFEALDTNAKRTFLRDYFNNDLIMAHIHEFLDCESDQEVDYRIEDIEKLVKNFNLVLTAKHVKALPSYLYDDRTALARLLKLTCNT